VATMMTGALPRRFAAGLAFAAAPPLGAAPAPGDLTVLNGLADIAEPPEPSAWPPNLWVLGLILAGLGLTALILSRLWQRYQRRRPYRAALVELAEWEHAVPSRSAGDAAATLTALLRRVALLHYPRDRVAPLSGTAFAAFLDEAMATPTFTQGPAADLLGDARYGARAAGSLEGRTELAEAARRWLDAHRDGAPRRV
jgi:hypothetical protein